MKKPWSILLALLLLAAPAAQAQWTCATNADNTLTITGYTGSRSSVTIPGTINSLFVTIIGPSAFGDQFSLTNLTLGGSLASIGEEAFANCGGLSRQKNLQGMARQSCHKPGKHVGHN
jgi:hypothetical protein